MRLVECPSCGNTTSSIWGKREQHEIFECETCLLIFFPRPISNYDYQEYYPYLKTFDADRVEWERQIRQRKFLTQLAFVRRLAPSAHSLLDVGAGPGYFVRTAADAGFSAMGVEPSDSARSFGEEHLAVRYTLLEDVPDASLDVVTCHHVLEHIEWPQPFIAAIRRKLRDNGILVVHVPNQQPLSFWVRDLISPNGSDTHCSMYYPVHINGFNDMSLRSTVERQSFECVSQFNVSMWSRHYDPFFLANYYRGQKSWITASVKVIGHAARCSVDVIGNVFGRGDWIVSHFRATRA